MRGLLLYSANFYVYLFFVIEGNGYSRYPFNAPRLYKLWVTLKGDKFGGRCASLCGDKIFIAENNGVPYDFHVKAGDKSLYYLLFVGGEVKFIVEG